jgi:exodeoxyribonuclease VII large subunit
MTDQPTISSIRLSELTTAVGEALKNAFGNRTYWVIADITSHTHKTDKNYHHLDLVEKDPKTHELLAKFHATAWGAGSRSIESFERLTGQRFTDNIQVLVNVSIQFHPVYGLALSIHQVDPNFTLGALEQRRQATLERLVLENPGYISKVGEEYHTHNKGLPLNRVLQRLAIVSSASSAGWQDFRHTLETNPYNYRFRLDDYFTLVQGEANAQQLVDRLIDIFNSNIPYDAVVIIRGGGAQTDFLLFDQYVLGKAIARFPIPVITGIGHQKNETIADLMAHTVTKTPTRAAELILAHNRGFEDSLTAFQKNIVIRTQQRLSTQGQTLARINSNLIRQTQTIMYTRGRELLNLASILTTQPTTAIAHKKKDLRQTADHLAAFTAHYLKNQRGYLGHYVSLINALSPQNTLNRGFAIVKKKDHILSDPDEIRKGDEIEVILREQSIHSTVKSKTPYHGRDFNL